MLDVNLHDFVDEMSIWFGDLGSGAGIFILICGMTLLGGLFVFVAISYHKYRSEVELTHYGSRKGGAPLTSFVCKECLHRSYAPRHIRDRYCAKCDKSFPEALKIWSPEQRPTPPRPPSPIQVGRDALSSLH
jgi:ribosomal protein L37E